MVRVLAITNIFPNARKPLLGPYNLQQLSALAELCDVDIMATIPWFPGARWMARWTDSGRMDAVPGQEEFQGLRVRHPRTIYVPRMLGLSAPLFAASLVPHVARYRGKVDVIFSAWAYPDGCASVALARMLGVPAVVKLHGSDINVYAHRLGARPYLRLLLPRASRVVAVSRALAQRVVELGVSPERVVVIYNGVDATLFRVRDRVQARVALGLPEDRKVILYAGNLLETKGVLDLAAAFERVHAARPHAMLVMVGNGPALRTCESVARRMGPCMKLFGGKPLDEVGMWMAACDVLTLPSWNEGTPNVILEAYACGRRVVATSVGGIPDLVDSDLLGELVAVRDPGSLAKALIRAVDKDYDPVEVARAGARGDWTQNAAHLHEVLRAAMSS